MLTNQVPAQIEAVLIELFWWYVKSGADRLELLKLYAVQPVTRSADWNDANIRADATARAARLSADQCFSCGTGDRRLYWHHVVQVQNGGSNHPRNFVAICYRCHAAIHPWLPPDRKGEQRGGEWWSFRDGLEDAQRRETALGDRAEGLRERPAQVVNGDAEEEMPF
jgi:hypothetical protein